MPVFGSTALVTGVSAGDIDALKTAIRTGGGFALSLAPVTLAVSTGVAAHSNLTMPDSGNLALADGHKYEFNGVFTARGGAGLLLGVRRVQNIVMEYDAAGPSWVQVETGQNVVSNKDATFSTFFASDANFPNLGDFNGTLAALYTVETGKAPTLEFDGTIKDLGVNT